MKRTKKHYYKMLGKHFDSRKDLIESIGLKSRNTFKQLRKQGVIERININEIANASKNVNADERYIK
jgi:hypothetical protein